MNSKVIVFFACALACASPVWSICDTLKHIDQTWAIRVQYFGNRDQKPVSNEQVYKDDCGTYHEGVNALTDYANNCLQGVSQTMGKIFMNSVREHYVKRCEDKQYGPDFIEHNKCFENQTIFEEFHLCADRFYHEMQQLKQLNLDPVKSIQASCCIIHDAQRCIRENNVNLCHDKNARFWDDTIDEEADDHRNEFCKDLRTTEQCEANFPKDLWAQLTGPVAKMDNNALKQKTGKFQSLIFTMLDMASGYTLNP